MGILFCKCELEFIVCRGEKVKFIDKGYFGFV